MPCRDLKVAYLCDQSPLDAWTYSGGNARLHRLVGKHIGETTILSEKWGSAEIFRQLLFRMPDAILLRARWRAHVFLSRLIAREVENELRKERYDVLFCPYSFHSLLNLRLPYPIVTVHSSDATPTTYKNSEVGANFGTFFAPSRLLDPLILEAEKKVFRSTDLLLWPSEWLKEKADALYGLDDQRSHVVPWGANIAPDDPAQLRLDTPISGDDVRLLLVGRDWFGKGGPTTVKVLDQLGLRGFKAHLTVAGCIPPDEDMRENMTVHGFLDRTKPAEKEVFEMTMLTSHFLVMASYESYGFAFAEASAFGLPSLGLKVGGVPIVEGVNGHALPGGSEATKFADWIQHYIERPEQYRALRHAARSYYEERLNWDAWGRRTSSLIRQKLEEKLGQSQ